MRVARRDLSRSLRAMANDKTVGVKIETSQALDLVGLVEYGPEAIVSRALVENDAGTITLFAFDENQGLSEHTAPFDAFVQVVDGQGEFIIGGESCRLRAGQVVVMPANIPHAVRATSRFKMLLTMLRKRGGQTA
jgi:quercetin dioxygenase-like cupin family protein